MSREIGPSPNPNVEAEDDNDSDDEEKRTIFCANLSEKVTDEILYELFLQSGPLQSVRIPKDKDGNQRSFGFVTYMYACSVPYALQLYAGIKLYNRELVMRYRGKFPVRPKSEVPSPSTPTHLESTMSPLQNNALLQAPRNFNDNSDRMIPRKYNKISNRNSDGRMKSTNNNSSFDRGDMRNNRSDSKDLKMTSRSNKNHRPEAPYKQSEKHQRGNGNGNNRKNNDRDRWPRGRNERWNRRYQKRIRKRQRDSTNRYVRRQQGSDTHALKCRR